MPKLICNECVEQIKQIYSFKNQCEMNEIILQKILSTTEKLIDDSDEFFIVEQESIDIKHNDDEYTNVEYLEEDMPEENHLECTDCGKSFKKDIYLKRHQLRHNITKESKNVYACTECDKIYTNELYLKRHKSHHKTVLTCTECHMLFESQTLYKLHIQEVHNGKKPRDICTECNKMVTNLTEHTKFYHTNELPYECTECNKKFPYKSTLDQHIEYRHRGKKKSVKKLCNLCGKQVFSNKALKYHMLSHTGEKPFECKACGKKFKSNSHKIVHEMNHTGVRPHVCIYCHKGFKTTSMLKCHLRTHTGECPYVCEICQRAFNQPSSLRTHMKIH